MIQSANTTIMSMKIIFIIGMIIPLSIAGYAQQTDPVGDAAPINSYQVWIQNLQNSLETETRSLNEIKLRDQKLRQDIDRYKNILNSYRIQLSSNNNLFFLPQTTLETLVRAASAQEQSLDFIDGLIKETTKNSDVIQSLQDQSAKQLHLYEQNTTATAHSALKETDQKEVADYLQRLVGITHQKQQILSEMAMFLKDYLGELNQIKMEFVEQANDFEDRIRQKRTRDRFERKAHAFDFEGWATFRSELQRIQSQINRLFKKDFWSGIIKHLWGPGGILFLTAGLLYAFLIAVLYRLKTFFSNLSSQSLAMDYPWCSLAIRLLCGSLLLMGTIIFLFSYTKLRGIYDNVPLINHIIQILLILLFTNWALRLLKLRIEGVWPGALEMPAYRLRMFVLVLRYTAITYVVLDGVLQNGAITLLLLRLAIELFIVAGAVSFIRQWEKKGKNKNPNNPIVAPSFERFCIIGIYIFIAAPVVMELIGYGSLAAYWLASWGRCVPVLFWAIIFYHILREWDQRFYAPSQDPSGKPAQPIKWLLFNVCWLAWALTTILLLILAWGGQQAVFTELGRVARYQVNIGNFSFSLLGLMQVFLILFFTHMIVRIWRYVLQEKVLGKSGLETGIKESIVSINVYVLWSIGILVSMSAFGVSGTSLTVAFGALSIGLGFGMQNIFNNFISGIIMLFERPIQVGDSVEINGIWGDVRKINFRSTVVQTYDNASLIIPNSDFISNQVTNWSFRDQSLRIKINVGVEYGSDIELVREVLLAIAEKTPKVRKTPKPDVIFQDFGDSALLFTLRVWTDIENMLKVATAIRFEIDAIFKEKNIGIPFPQRDLHLKSISESIKIELTRDQDIQS